MKASTLRKKHIDAVQAMRVIRDDGLQEWMPISAEGIADRLVSGVEV